MTSSLTDRPDPAHGGPPPAILRFRDYALVRSSRTLLRGGLPVEIGGRAFDLLELLLLNRGRLVTKAQVFAHVWPSIAVEETNLRFQIAALRKVLGDARDLIKTVPCRGYMFALEDDLKRLGLPAGGGRRPPAEPDGPGGAEHDFLGFGSPILTGATPQPDVAVIDDDEGARVTIGGLLESVGLRVVSFADAEAFLLAFPGLSPRCLVVDVWMPGRSGLDLQAELNEAGSRIPIVFVSGHADVHTSVRAMKSGAFDFLTKPVRHAELLSVVRSAIGAPAPEPHGGRRPPAGMLSAWPAAPGGDTKQ